MYKKVVEKFLELKLISLIRDDDRIDQLHHRVVTLVLLVMAGFFSAKTKWGSIDCWIPKEYDSDNFKLYIIQYCWISNLYRVPFYEELPVEVEERMSTFRSVNFYRWVFLVFIIQAFMFKVPNMVWRALNTFSGINIRKVAELALKTQIDGEENRDANMKQLSTYIDRWLKACRKFDKHGRLAALRSRLSAASSFGRHSGSYLTRLYVFIKLLYFINVLAQFQILTTYLHFNYWTYGSEVVELITGEDPWRDRFHFPRVAMCDLEVRQLQNIQRHTYQCTLPMNMFVEKAYAVMWFLMVILAILTLYSMLQWIVEDLFTSRRAKFFEKYINWMSKDGEEVDRRLFKLFVGNYLRDDGVFLTRLLTYNTGELLTVDLLKQLWRRFKKEQHKTDDEDIEYTPETKPLRNSPS